MQLKKIYKNFTLTKKVNKSDNKVSFAWKALIGQNLENYSRDFVVDHKCPNLKVYAKFLIET